MENNPDHIIITCFTASPFVKSYDKPKNVIEGDPLSLECQAWGYPHVNVTWYAEGVAIVADGVRIKLSNGTNLENSLLRIENMEFDDQGIFTCVAENDAGINNETIQIRVKGKTFKIASL